MTLASRHIPYVYNFGWIADYNHILDWLGPMYLATGTYPSWNQLNNTKLNDLYFQAVDADAKGDVPKLLEIGKEMNKIVLENVYYFLSSYPLTFYVRSTWLQGWYFNLVNGGGNPPVPSDYLVAMSYAPPSS